MELSQSSVLYLENYYLLDQARQESLDYLEKLLTRAVELSEEQMNALDTGLVRFGKYIQKDGGYAEFHFIRSEPLPELPTIERWKFAIVYRDVIRTDNLKSPTNCRMYCFTPQSYSAQIESIKKMASKLNVPDPYKDVEFSVIDLPFEEAVQQISTKFIEFKDNFLKIISGLIEEYQNS